MKKSNLIAILIAVLSFTVNAQSKRKLIKQMDSWVGATKHELIMGFGPASRIASDGNGGEILIYSKIRQINRDVLRLSADGTLYNEQRVPDVYYQHKMFYLDSRNKVYHWLIESNNIPPERLVIGGTMDINVYSR